MIAHRLPLLALEAREGAPADGRARLARALASIDASPGQGFRPRLVAAVGEVVRLDPRSRDALGSALEAWHEASLVLDDLPCMDDAVTRRGAPALHLVHGEDLAILASLARIATGYADAWSVLGALPPAAREEARRELAACLGEQGLVGGQAIDLTPAPRCPRAAARWAGRAAVGKTQPLLRLALLLPALAGGASAAERAHLRRLAVAWGLGYQLLDDADDLVEPEGSDLRLGRPNLAHLLGDRLDARIARLRGQSARAIAALEAIRPSWGVLRPFARHALREPAQPARASNATVPCVPSCA